MIDYFTSFTVTIASPGVFTLADHELSIGDTVWLETTGALPTGLSVDTTYYVVMNGFTASTFQLSESKGGTAIDTSGSQSGAHTLIKTDNNRFIPNVEDTK